MPGRRSRSRQRRDGRGGGREEEAGRDETPTLDEWFAAHDLERTAHGAMTGHAPVHNGQYRGRRMQGHSHVYRADGFSPAPTRLPYHGERQGRPYPDQIQADVPPAWGGGSAFLQQFSPLPIPEAAPHPLNSDWQVV